MALLAKRLPVTLIPKQPLVTSVRNDVIHHGRWNHLPFLLAEDTQRMLLQEKSAGFTPAGIISTGIRTSS
jgi:hypothetical protein